MNYILLKQWKLLTKMRILVFIQLEKVQKNFAKLSLDQSNVNNFCYSSRKFAETIILRKLFIENNCNLLQFSHSLVFVIFSMIYFIYWMSTVLFKSKCSHSVLERIWVKGSNLSKWLPQGERGPPKESKSLWIEIIHVGSH